MTDKTYDVIIVGAGPAGSACAIELAKTGLRAALLDKATFPRDKTCGDALSVDVINQLKKLSETLATEFEALENKMASCGVKIFSPDHNHIDIPFIYKNVKSCGYISPRLHFDNLLFQHAKKFAEIDVYENCAVTNVSIKDNKSAVQTSCGLFTGEIVVGADGAHSIVSKVAGDIKVDKKHHSAGLRMYYEGVTGFHDEGFIELHFFKDILPGYLWIFPLAGNKANVGIGMLSSTVSKKKVNLKETLQKLLKTHPHLIERFKDAKPLETVKGYGLPLGSKKRHLSGERFLLAGDAAALIDPFSGEGIANAIRSGRVAAGHIVTCFESNDFSANFNKAYDKEIYRRMWKEFEISRALQYIVTFPALFNFVIKKANQNKYLQKLLIDALANADEKNAILFEPAFYYRMFFK